MQGQQIFNPVNQGLIGAYNPLNPQINNPIGNTMSNQYLSQMLQNQHQQIQQLGFQNQSNILLGKVVDSVQVVEATDIPMDNNPYYFPKADGTEIYVKKWMPNFQTRIIVYKPFIEEDKNNEVEQNNYQNIDLTEMMDKINGINDIVSNLDRMLNSQRQNVNKNKKEVKSDEQ